MTTLRGIAALWVVAYHLVSNLSGSGYLARPAGLSGNLVAGGEFAVDLFFLLSGYVLTMATPERIDYRGFLTRRIARVFPLHLVVLSAMVAGIAAMRAAGIATRDPAFFSFAALPAHFSLTWVWFGLPLGWNSPTWSLSVEFAGYLVFPVMLAWCRRAGRPAQFAVLGTAILGDMVLLSLTDFPSTGGLALLRGAFGLGAGAALRLICGERSPPYATAAAAGLLASLAVGLPALAVPCAACLVPALGGLPAGRAQRALSAGPLAWAGRVSYSIYLVHVPILIVFLQALHRLAALQTAAGLGGWAVCYIGAVLLCAGVTWRVVERPGQRFIRALLSRRTGADRIAEA